MADDLTPLAPPSLDTLLDEIEGETQKLKTQTGDITSSVSVITDRLPKVRTAVNQLKEAVTAAAAPLEKKPLTGAALDEEKFFETVRLGVVAVLAGVGFVAACFACAVAGWIATVGADVYLAIILWAAAIRSDTTYHIAPSVKTGLSHLKPTKLLAHCLSRCCS